jgi:hypothetical protein
MPSSRFFPRLPALPARERSFTLFTVLLPGAGFAAEQRKGEEVAMRNSVKGALLSALLLPGAGQLWLKHYLRGFALIATFSVAFAVVALKAFRQALSILEQIETSGGAVDLVAIMGSASHSSAFSDGLMSASTLLVVCWVVGIVDAYLAGNRKDLAEQSPLAPVKRPGRPKKIRKISLLR